MNYSAEILNAHSQYLKAEAKCDNLNEWDIKYKSKRAAAQSKWKVFSDLCKAEILKPVEVSHTIQNINAVTIKLKKMKSKSKLPESYLNNDLSSFNSYSEIKMMLMDLARKYVLSNLKK